MKSFPEGSLAKLIAEFSPVPNAERLEDKFEFFYRPYNYTCNAQKYIDFGEELKADPFLRYTELIENVHFLDEYL